MHQVWRDGDDFAIGLLQWLHFFWIEMQRHLGRLRLGQQHVGKFQLGLDAKIRRAQRLNDRLMVLWFDS